MAEYTTEQNNELIETIKNPETYFTLNINGYGCETVFIELTKEQHEYWSDVLETQGEEAITEYLLNYEGDVNEDYATYDVDKELDFLREDDTRHPWFDAPTDAEHSYGVESDGAYIEIIETDKDGAYKDDVTDAMEIWKYISDNDVETDGGCVSEGLEPQYTMHIDSAEKGNFFSAEIQTSGKFDPAKLKITTQETWAGVDIITDVAYDGEDLDNIGGDTNSKGFTVQLWNNSED